MYNPIPDQRPFSAIGLHIDVRLQPLLKRGRLGAITQEADPKYSLDASDAGFCYRTACVESLV